MTSLGTKMALAALAMFLITLSFALGAQYGASESATIIWGDYATCLGEVNTSGWEYYAPGLSIAEDGCVTVTGSNVALCPK